MSRIESPFPLKAHDVRCIKINSLHSHLIALCNGHIVLFNMDTCELIDTIYEVGYIASCTFSNDGKYIIACASRMIAGNRRSIILKMNLACKIIFEWKTAHEYIYALSISHDDTLIAVGGCGVIQLLNATDGSICYTIDASDIKVDIRTLIISSPCNSLISVTGALTVWNMHDGSLKYKINGCFQDSTVTISPDNNMILSANWNKTLITPIQLHDLRSGKLIREFLGNKRHVSTTAFSPNGNMVAAGCLGYKAYIDIWNTYEGSLMYTIDGCNILNIVYYNENLIMSCNANGAIEMLNIATRARPPSALYESSDESFDESSDDSFNVEYCYTRTSAISIK